MSQSFIKFYQAVTNTGVSLDLYTANVQNTSNQGQLVFAYGGVEGTDANLTYTLGSTLNANVTVNIGNNLVVAGTINAAALNIATEGVYANGTVVVGNVANINFNNTATINVGATANGIQANVGLSVNVSAVLGNVGTIANLAFDQATAAYDQANVALRSARNISSGNTSNINVTYANGSAVIDTRIPPGGGAGSPGGTNTDIQYNKAGVFGGDANLVWDYGNQKLTILGMQGTGHMLVLQNPYPRMDLISTGNSNNAGYRFQVQNTAGNSQSAGIYATPSDFGFQTIGLYPDDINYALQVDSRFVTVAKSIAVNTILNPIYQTEIQTGVGLDPTLGFYRGNSAVGFGIGRIWWDGVNSNANGRVSYARIQSEIENNVAGSEQGRIVFSTAQANVITTVAVMNGNNMSIGTATPTLANGAYTSNQALFVQRHSGAIADGDVIYTDGNHWYRFNSNSGSSNFNGLVQANDHTIIFSDDVSDTGNLVIGPWTGNSGANGIYIVGKSGNTGIGQNNPQVRLDVNGAARAVTHQDHYANTGTPSNTSNAIVTSNNCTVYSNGTIIVTDPSSANWDAYAFGSAMSACMIRAQQTDQGGSGLMIGITQNPTSMQAGGANANNTYVALDFALYYSSGTFTEYVNGNPGSTFSTYNAANGGAVMYDGNNVTYFANTYVAGWVPLKTVNKPGLTVTPAYVGIGSRSGNIAVNTFFATAQTIDVSVGTYQDITLANNILIALQNCATTGNTSMITLMFRQTGQTNCGVAFSNTIRWSDNKIPGLSAGPNTGDIISLFTYNGGTSWWGSQVMGNVASANVY